MQKMCSYGILSTAFHRKCLITKLVKNHFLYWERDSWGILGEFRSLGFEGVTIRKGVLFGRKIRKLTS